jgi:hypothetical protein
MESTRRIVVDVLRELGGDADPVLLRAAVLCRMPSVDYAGRNRQLTLIERALAALVEEGDLVPSRVALAPRAPLTPTTKRR